jgi:hypothetical protein
MIELFYTVYIIRVELFKASLELAWLLSKFIIKMFQANGTRLNGQL